MAEIPSGAVFPDRGDKLVDEPAGGLVRTGAGQREHDVPDAGGSGCADVGAGGGGVGVVDDDLRGAGDLGGVAADRRPVCVQNGVDTLDAGGRARCCAASARCAELSARIGSPLLFVAACPGVVRCWGQFVVLLGGDARDDVLDRLTMLG
ncbi:hypothetical protein [Streptomyces sp. NPDC050704]|uniref:hypothetical protein n=1 Tax=Streptomyces sp. NPDC050704 TaxID=3157219 RepID=UPI00343F1875